MLSTPIADAFVTAPQVHGDVAEHELQALGLSRAEVVDFAVNINPYGPPPGLAEHLAACDVSRYPDRHCRALLDALSEHTASLRAKICVGNGASELLWAAIRTWCPRGGKLLTVEPTFSEALSAAKSQHAQVVQCWLDAADGFAPNLQRLREWLQRERPNLVYLCQPNNPTGQYWQPAGLVALARCFAEVTFVLDEAFLALSEYHGDAGFTWPDNIVRIRSLTKDLAIAGLRLAYALADECRAAALTAQLPPWNVNTLAQAAGVYGLQHWQHVEQCRSALLADRSNLEAGLKQRGFHVLSSTTIFVLVRVQNAAVVRAECLKQGVLVRDCTSFGLPEWLRLCARPETDRARLFAAFEADG